MNEKTDPLAAGPPPDPGQKIPDPAPTLSPVEVEVEKQEVKPSPLTSIADEFISRLTEAEKNVESLTSRIDQRETKERRAGRAGHYRTFRAGEFEKRTAEEKKAAKKNRPNHFKFRHASG